MATYVNTDDSQGLLDSIYAAIDEEASRRGLTTRIRIFFTIHPMGSGKGKRGCAQL